MNATYEAVRKEVMERNPEWQIYAKHCIETSMWEISVHGDWEGQYIQCVIHDQRVDFPYGIIRNKVLKMEKKINNMNFCWQCEKMVPMKGKCCKFCNEEIVG